MSVTKITLYEGKVTMIFDSYFHTYTATDEENGVVEELVPSVTKITGIIDKSKQLVPWAVNQTVDYLKSTLIPGKSYDEVEIANILATAKKAHYKTRDDAGDYGTLLHKWVESFARGENPNMPINPMLNKAVKDFLKWVVEDDVKFVCSEQPLYSRKYKVAGTLDTMALVKGKLYLGDWKTSSGIYLEQKIQAGGGYRMLREEEYPEEKIYGTFVMRFGKDGTFEKQFLKESYEDLKVMFLSFMFGGNLYRQIEEKRK